MILHIGRSPGEFVLNLNRTLSTATVRAPYSKSKRSYILVLLEYLGMTLL